MKPDCLCYPRTSLLFERKIVEFNHRVSDSDEVKKAYEMKLQQIDIALKLFEEWETKNK